MDRNLIPDTLSEHIRSSLEKEDFVHVLLQVSSLQPTGFRYPSWFGQDDFDNVLFQRESLTKTQEDTYKTQFKFNISINTLARGCLIDRISYENFKAVLDLFLNNPNYFSPELGDKLLGDTIVPRFLKYSDSIRFIKIKGHYIDKEAHIALNTFWSTKAYKLDTPQERRYKRLLDNNGKADEYKVLMEKRQIQEAKNKEESENQKFSLISFTVGNKKTLSIEVYDTVGRKVDPKIVRQFYNKIFQSLDNMYCFRGTLTEKVTEYYINMEYFIKAFKKPTCPYYGDYLQGKRRSDLVFIKREKLVEAIHENINSFPQNLREEIAAFVLINELE